MKHSYLVADGSNCYANRKCGDATVAFANGNGEAMSNADITGLVCDDSKKTWMMQGDRISPLDALVGGRTMQMKTCKRPAGNTVVHKRLAAKAAVLKKPASRNRRGSAITSGFKGFMNWPADLKAAVQEELQRGQSKLTTAAGCAELSVDGAWRCPMCPATTIAHEGEDAGKVAKSLASHFHRHHLEVHHGTNSTKQCRIMAAAVNLQKVGRCSGYCN